MKPLTPQEVRLGNLTSHGVVIEIDNDCFYTIQGEWIYRSIAVDILPVPLTPEILEGFGFERESETLFSKNDIAIRNYSTKNDCYFSVEVNNGTFQIQHAHTLQNFIHAISGVELVYNNKLEHR